MSSVAPAIETTNPVTGFTHAEMKAFVREHFDEFINRKNLAIGNVNFGPEFVDHGAELPSGTPAGPAGPMAHMGSV